MDNFKYEPLSLERIQAEQDKHIHDPNIAYDVTSIKSISKEDLLGINTFMDKLIRDLSHETDLYIICEMAKAYLNEHREAHWEKVNGTNLETGKRCWYMRCSNCGEMHGIYYTQTPNIFINTHRYYYCNVCGAKMKLR